MNLSCIAQIKRPCAFTSSKQAAFRLGVFTMNSKTLVIHPEKCTGCGDCEKTCAMKHSGLGYAGRSRIRIVNENRDENFFLATTCQQCEDPPCLATCPNEVIYRDEALSRVMIDNNRCVGCKMCISACPFGAMGFDPDRGQSVKCDLCGGDPECVRVCETGALEYAEPEMLQVPQMVCAAAKLSGVVRHMVV